MTKNYSEWENNTKYYNTWGDIVKCYADDNDKNTAAMQKKMMKSEDIVFQYVMNLLL